MFAAVVVQTNSMKGELNCASSWDIYLASHTDFSDSVMTHCLFH